MRSGKQLHVSDGAFEHGTHGFACRCSALPSLRIPPAPVIVVFQFGERTSRPSAKIDFIDRRRDRDILHAALFGNCGGGLPSTQAWTALDVDAFKSCKPLRGSCSLLLSVRAQRFVHGSTEQTAIRLLAHPVAHEN